MPGCKHNQSLKLWFSRSLHDGGLGLRINDDPDLKRLIGILMSDACL